MNTKTMVQEHVALVGGKAVHASAEFKDLSPPPLAVMPEWSPVAHYRSYGARFADRSPALAAQAGAAGSALFADHAPWGAGCDCFAF